MGFVRFKDYVKKESGVKSPDIVKTVGDKETKVEHSPRSNYYSQISDDEFFERLNESD